MSEENPQAFEVNFDGLALPSHCYAGLAKGNLASTSHKAQSSSPKQAALQGLEKMRALHQLGFKQALLPPVPRPQLQLLEELGFYGSLEEQLQQAAKEAPNLLAALWSSSSMWAANSAMVCPSTDSADRKLHLSPANLISKFHRSLEAAPNTRIFQRIFPSPFFKVHSPLPACDTFACEGAANHTRLCPSHDKPGIQLFVYGRSSYESFEKPKRYPARQSKEACQAYIRKHQIPEERCVLAQQNPELIDLGVFHNDVISVGNENLLLYHERAYVKTEQVIENLQKAYRDLHGEDFLALKITEDQLPAEEAVSSYFFNSQVLSLKKGEMLLLAPKECEENPKVKSLIHKLLEDPSNPLSQLQFFDLRQSMQNGGGPACLRLRVVLNDKELSQIHQGILFTDSLYQKLKTWTETHFRDKLELKDLEDPKLAAENRQALLALEEVLDLKGIYEN